MDNSGTAKSVLSVYRPTSSSVEYDQVARAALLEVQQVLGVADTRLGVRDGLVT